MVTSGTQTASTAGVSMPGVLAIFKNWEGDYCFPGTPSPSCFKNLVAFSVSSLAAPKPAVVVLCH